MTRNNPWVSGGGRSGGMGFGVVLGLVAAFGCSSSPFNNETGGRGAGTGGSAGRAGTTGGNTTGGSSAGGGGARAGAGGGGGARGAATGGASTGGAATAGAGAGGRAGGGGGAHGGAGGKALGGSAGGRGGAGGAPGGGLAGAPAGGGGAGAQTTAVLLDDLAKAFCAAARGCCSKKNLPTTLTDCEAQFPSRLSGLDYVKRGTETIDNAALARCVAGYKETQTTCAFQPLEVACKNVFLGTKAEGAACGMGGVPSVSGAGECKRTGRSTTCLWTGDSNLTTTTGVCFTPPHAKKGEPCGGSCAKNEDCVWDTFQSPDYPTALCFEEDGLHCATGVDPAVCVPIVPTGGNCDSDPFACASTDRCGAAGDTSVCIKAQTLGQSCAAGLSCAWGMSLFCNPDSNLCEDLGFAYERTCGGEPPFP